jgi:molybdopterin-synthase adenylyltransferase
MDNCLGEEELLRYQRQLSIPLIGIEGQHKFKKAHIVIAGIGGLGCSSSLYLTAAGIGHITLVDFDIVELSDLNRQILYCQEDIGKKKVNIAKKRISRLNPTIELQVVDAEISRENVSEIISRADVIIDGLDNIETRLVLNKACVQSGKPFIYGGVSQLRGMATTIIPGKTPCIQCISPEGTKSSRVLAMSPAIIANIQALEVIKLVLGEKPSLAGKLLMFNGDDMKFKILDIVRNVNCAVCGSQSTGPRISQK